MVATYVARVSDHVNSDVVTALKYQTVIIKLVIC